MKKKQKNNNSAHSKCVTIIISIAIPLIPLIFWAGWYTHSNISSVEFHEKQMQLYNSHQQIDEGYKNDIRQLESEKRELEKELYELRQEKLKNNKSHD